MKPLAATDLASKAPSSPASAPLTFHRLPIAAEGRTPEGLLGGRWVGRAPEALDATLFAPEGAVLDAWAGAPQPQVQRHGCVEFVTDGQWLHGVATVSDAELGVQEAAKRAYDDLFAVLAATPCTHLLRLWNYLADINGAAPDGTERYRLFNAGRQLAFLDAQRSAFEGSPAACALGVAGGPLRVYFLAGRVPPVAIENPRQVSAYRYPTSYGPRAPTFSRAALADVGGGRQALFISGTASIVGHQTLHLGDVRRQTEESLANIAAVREAARAPAGREIPAQALHYTVYVRHEADVPAVREVFEAAVGRGTPAARDAVYLRSDICRAELLVEIEGHGILGERGGA